MNNRIWILGTVIVSLAVMVLGFLLGIQPKLTEMSNNAAALATAEGQNAIYAAELEALKVQYESIDEVRAKLEELRKSLPAEGDYEGFLRELDAAAAATGTTITTYNQSAPVVYGPAAAPDPADPAAAPVIGGTLLGIPIDMTISSTDPQTLFAFINQLRLGERLFLLGSFSLSASNGAFALTFSAHVFTLVDPSAVPVGTDVVTDPAIPTETPAPEDTAVAPDPAATDSAVTPDPANSATPSP